MLKKRIATFVMGLALLVAVAGASATMVASPVASAPSTGQAIACATSGSSGGGC